MAHTSLVELPISVVTPASDAPLLSGCQVPSTKRSSDEPWTAQISLRLGAQSAVTVAGESLGGSVQLLPS